MAVTESIIGVDAKKRISKGGCSSIIGLLKGNRDGIRKTIHSIKYLVLFFCILFLQKCNISGHNRSTDDLEIRSNNLLNKRDLLPVKGFLFNNGVPFLECHASTLIHLKNGNFITAWFGGTKEGENDVGIWMTRGRPDHWEKPFEVAKINSEPHWNPVLFQSSKDKIYLFFKVGKQISCWQTWVKTSTDGNSWSRAKELVKKDYGGRGPVRNKVLVLSNGTWLAGASNEQGEWNAFFDRSNDQGNTWQATSFLSLDRKEFRGKGIIQPTLWESSPGMVHALLRSSTGVVCRSDSKDYGKTWSQVYKTTLPNPNSAIDLAKLSDGTLVLACNPTTRNSGSRSKLVLAMSFDNGNTWPKKIPLADGMAKDEFSYPAIINFSDTIAVTYTWKRKKIAFWMATKDWILKNAKPF